MNFAGKAYVKKKPINPVSAPPKPPSPPKSLLESEEHDEEIKLPPAPAQKLKRKRSFERLSISSLNHSLNSNSESDSDEERDQVPLSLNREKIELRVDTNVVSMDLGSLKSAVIMATGDPIFCQQCKVAFNLYSRISELSESEQLWICEFCGFNNNVNIDPEEIPRGQILDYMLMSSQQVIEEHKERKSGITVIFCIDISGSMCVTEPVNGKIALKNKKQVDLGGFADFDMVDQYLRGDDGVTYISRLECVQAAIESQLQTLAKTYPDYKVGLVTFNSEVSIYGDGSSAPIVLAGNKLNSFESCFEAGAGVQNKLSLSIKDTHELLVEKLLGLNENGPTALGPALISSLALASNGIPGSRVIICTDGLANVGIGRLDDDPGSAEIFYLRAGNIAKDKGIEVSVVSIQGEECKLSMLSKVSEMTGGEVTRVNLNNIANEFANILEVPIIASQVSAIIKIHKGLSFRYQDEYLVDPSTMKRELGNVAEGSEFTFEYSVRPAAELEALQIDIESLNQLPFQSQIHFTNKEGMKCMRVITALQDTTDDLEKAGDINFKVIGVNAAQRSAHLASKGEYRESQAVMRSWKRMMKRNAKNSEQSEAVDYYLSNMADFNRNLNSVAKDEALLCNEERASNQKDHISHMAFRAKKASKGEKKECSIM